MKLRLNEIDCQSNNVDLIRPLLSIPGLVPSVKKKIYHRTIMPKATRRIDSIAWNYDKYHKLALLLKMAEEKKAETILKKRHIDKKQK